MSTSIKIDKNIKIELDKLQAKITLKTGHKLSQQELLKKIFNFTNKNEEKFFQDFILEWSPLSDDEWEDIISLITDFGIETKESNIDQELYGFQNDTN